jgi:HD-GYP domain-containing protein (c-di-GMP phosphodiesterase class II)
LSSRSASTGRSGRQRPFDALTSERPYRAALSESDAMETIRADAGLDQSVAAALEAIL